ncbi:MAG TPA: hypothetical protein VII56_10390 [Rhizomicrobium sp.]
MKRNLAFIAVLGLAIVAQATPLAGSAAPHGHVAPRHPDLNGVWQVLNTANWDIEPHAARAALAFRPGPFGPVPAKEIVAMGAVGSVPAGLGFVEGGAIPYTPEALAAKKDNQAHWLERDPEIKCYLPGVPRANYMPYPFQIFQSDEAMVFAYEYAGAVRNIMFKDPGPPPVDAWMGQSVGHWEGNTLVVVVTGQNDSTWFDRAGNHHSADMKVVERYTLIAPGVMRYEAEITDPATFTRPWTLKMNLYRRVGEDARLQQFKCVEFVEELMYGRLRKEPLP